MTSTPPAGAAGTLPTALRWAVGLIFGEALAIGGVTVFLAYEDVVTPATDLRAALFLTGFAVLAAVAVAAMARALGRRRGGARGPAVVVQLMLLSIAYFMVRGGLAWLGILIGVLALLIIGLLVAPSTTRALGLR